MNDQTGCLSCQIVEMVETTGGRSLQSRHADNCQCLCHTQTQESQS